ncbi:hypothetical protein U1872_08125 [Sphingomonas sp. RB3P16]|uniref:hypothetical protein n=1 Tax=Parasphingomonas frigoris TaxID=3096163 RepID=UPI002FC7D67A
MSARVDLVSNETQANQIATAVATCRLKADLYSSREVEFLRSVAGRDRLSAAQFEWLLALAERERLDFHAINTAALGRLQSICERWLPDGLVRGNEFTARNPTRADGDLGSFKINLSTGRWADFAVAEARGGDPISLAAYLFHAGDQLAAAKDLKRMVGQ